MKWVLGVFPPLPPAYRQAGSGSFVLDACVQLEAIFRPPAVV